MSERAIYDLGRGAVMEEADAAMFDELNANLRDADRRECEVFGRSGEDIANWQNAWGVRYKGDLMCILGWAKFPGDTEDSTRRLMLCMSTNNVWKHPIEYARRSKEMFAFMLRFLPEQVTDVYSLPLAEYVASVEWQKRMLGFEKEKDVDWHGIRHTLMHKRIKEVT